ncbi:small conductance mechanosensitive channel [Clostridium acidisoli DSM 12555]|uniref:Small conductance mechanosensitive channel n=1 Tax=Clostridium acidisoli DSM 12555 TaxID=1121291 RepID=A0A1W1XX56_9CLOT|nr:mechanosensitive ion channel domain-containing protein [Clostridium acidisoli]SMC28445.1 small conductance mechanosensitive channel [Clostridium acidisoli DSM 12555]
MLSKLSITSLGNFDLGKISSESFNINKFLDNCLQIVIILVVMYIAVKLGSKIIEKTLKKQQIMFSIDEKKSKTLIAVLKSILRYTVYFLGIMGIFSTVSLTAASIGGVTVGLASQSLIKDVINGIFILFENQYTVGENVTIEQKAGIVESLELRVTKIRDFNGDLHIIPNGSIKNVTNHSRGNIRIAANICVDYSENIDNVFKIINEACEKFANEAEQDIIEKPKVFGITDFKAIGINVMIVGKVKPSTQGTNEVELRRFIIKELNQNNIKLASNNLEGTGR